jgi:hypothetical protein
MKTRKSNQYTIIIAKIFLILLLFCQTIGSSTIYRITEIYGNGVSSEDNLQANETIFNFPMGIWLNENDTLFIADTKNHVVRYIDSNNRVHILAGTLGQPGYSGMILCIFSFLLF